jgi:hypothetical protein
MAPPVERREVELRFTTNRALPDVCSGLTLCEFMFEQAMLDRNKPDENLRWLDIQQMVTRSVYAINAMNPGLQMHTPMPIPIPTVPYQPPPEVPIGDEPPAPDAPRPLHRRRAKKTTRRLQV